MILRIKYAIVVLFFGFTSKIALAQNLPKPCAEFSFNNKKNYDEQNPMHVAKFVGASFTEDRFGNANNAAYVYGHDFSYINLGNYKEIKPLEGTISLWVKIERVVASGKGYKANPLILTKAREEDDFYEAYGIYYIFDRNKIVTNTARDSLRQITITSKEEFTLLEWHHLALTYDNDFFSFYIDGDLERKEIKKFETKFLETDSVLIGISANEKNKRFSEGAVDDIKFYDKVLTKDEILDLYHAPNPNKRTILIHRILIVIAILAIILILYFLIKYQLTLTLKKEKKQLELDKLVLETELRVNRALMNPHFVFNSLSALQSFILKDEIDLANNYLVKFSKLMRKILEGNLQDLITLDQEIQLLTGYLEIEELRFEENIYWSIEVIDNTIPSTIKIPIMMLQPFIENTIWHGLLKKVGEKTLKISFSTFEQSYLKCVIEDNGIGRKNSMQYNIEKRSLATGFIKQRLALINSIHKTKCEMTIEDKINDGGTIVTILLPIFKNTNP